MATNCSTVGNLYKQYRLSSTNPRICKTTLLLRYVRS